MVEVSPAEFPGILDASDQLLHANRKEMHYELQFVPSVKILLLGAGGTGGYVKTRIFTV